jgi:membrane protease YdiL (CAAX protease family)
MSSLLQFFLLTYGVSWACFFGAAATMAGGGQSSHVLAFLRGPLYFLGVLAPALAALLLTKRDHGRAGVLSLLRRILRWRTNVQFYLFAMGYMAVTKLAVALLYRVATGGWPRLGQEAWYIIAVAIVLSTPVQAGEEVGWRGYALPQLAARLGLARASLVLGVVWACWHLPFFFFRATDKFGHSFPVYLLQVTALSVAAAWLYWRTGQSLLLVMLLHSAVNQSIGIVPSTVPNPTNPFSLSSSLVAWLTVALLWVSAACFLTQMRKANLPSDWGVAPVPKAATGMRG